MAEDKHANYMYLAIVAIVAIVALVVLFSSRGVGKTSAQPTVLSTVDEESGNLGGQALRTVDVKQTTNIPSETPILYAPIVCRSTCQYQEFNEESDSWVTVTGHCSITNIGGDVYDCTGASCCYSATYNGPIVNGRVSS